MDQPPIIHVYVSYSTKHKEELQSLENSFDIYNKNPDSNFKIEIKYSENTLEDGDKIIRFMDEIAVSGFVLLFLSKEYFESAFCWYELINAHENKRLESRSFIIPLAMEGKENAIGILKNNIKTWGEMNEDCQQELRRLFNLSDDKIIDKLKVVTTEFLEPSFGFLNKIKTSDAIVEEVENRVTDHLKSEQEEIDKIIKDKILKALTPIKNIKESWNNSFNIALDKHEIEASLNKLSHVDALLKIFDWLEVEKQLGETGNWSNFFKAIEEISGWILLRSINKDWWINNKLALTKGIHHEGFVQLPLEQEFISYSEIVVSRTVIRVPKYVLDETSHLIPADKINGIKEGNTLVFDGSDDAVLHSLLVPIITDLRKATPTIEDSMDLINDLFAIAKINQLRKKYVFYVVTEGYLKKLQNYKVPNDPEKSLLETIHKNLEGTLCFISIGTTLTENSLQVTDDAKLTITLMEQILLFNK